MAIPIAIDPSFRTTGRPYVIRVIPGLESSARLANGDIFHTRRVEEEGASEDGGVTLKVVINWFEEIKKIAPHPNPPRY